MKMNRHDRLVLDKQVIVKSQGVKRYVYCTLNGVFQSGKAQGNLSGGNGVKNVAYSRLGDPLRGGKSLFAY